MAEVGRYRVVRSLGRGGMAEVLEAVVEGSSGFTRRVAIKRLHPGADDPRLVEMFLDEAQIASHLHHGGIVGVLDFGVADGRPFQVIELVDGIDAAALVRSEREVPPEVALHICAQIAEALAYAHAARGRDGRPLGIVHRDVKPENILLSWSGDVKLGDFGIAFAAERTHQTQAGVMKGTFVYMAPEQATRGELDGRADVFALGCVLHALVAGESPTAGDGLMELIAGEELELSNELPIDIAAIVRRATARSAADRYGDAGEMAAALAGALAARGASGRLRLRGFLDELRPDLERAVPDEHSGELLVGTAAETPRSKKRASTAEPRRSLWPALALFGLGAIGIAGFALALALRESKQPAVAALDAARPDAAVAQPIDAISPISIDATLPAPIDARAAPVEARPRRPRRPEPDAAPTPAPAPAPVDGYLRVGGGRALGAEIRVDGKRRGFAPRLIRVSAGPHRVVLIARDGSTIASREVTVTERHTRSRPLSWIVKE